MKRPPIVLVELSFTSHFQLLLPLFHSCGYQQNVLFTWYDKDFDNCGYKGTKLTYLRIPFQLQRACQRMQIMENLHKHSNVQILYFFLTYIIVVTHVCYEAVGKPNITTVSSHSSYLILGHTYLSVGGNPAILLL